MCSKDNCQIIWPHNIFLSTKKAIELPWILHFDSFWNDKLEAWKKPRLTKSSRKGGGVRVETNFVDKRLALRWGSALIALPEKFERYSELFSEVRKESVVKTIIRDIWLKAPSDLVFNFVLDPHNLPEIWPSIVEVKTVKKSKNNDGFNFNWDYKMAGMQFEGKCETIEHHPYDRLAIKSINGLDSTITWDFQPAGQETHVTLKFEYQVPTSLLKRTKEEIIIEENEHEVDAMLQNLKTRLELQPVRV